MRPLIRYVFEIKRSQARQILMNPIRTKKKIFVDFYVARPGFEPRLTGPKPVVLPLYYRAIYRTKKELGSKEIANIDGYDNNCKFIFNFY